MEKYFIKEKNRLHTKLFNKIYNWYFTYTNKIKFNDKKITVEMSNHNLLLESSDEIAESIKHSTGWYPYFQETVWLLNLKRLYKMFKKNYNDQDYHFLDVGCGNGIALIYAYKKLNFKSISGFDIVEKFLDYSEKNISSSINQPEKIKIFKADANEYCVEDKPHFVFMFNPFDAYIFNNFLKNNYHILTKTKSVIAYSNSLHLNVLEKFKYRKLEKVAKYKLALIHF